jgi:hypothetical protein
MTDLRGEPADLSSEPIVPLQLDAASGPEQVITEKALETGSRSLGANAWRDLRRRPMFWISLALIVVFMLMAKRLRRSRLGHRWHSGYGVLPGLRMCGRDHCRIPRRLA